MKNSIHRLLVSLLVFAVTTVVVHADEIHLKDGRRITGQVRSEKNGKVTIERTYGMLTIDKSDVVKIVRQNNDVFDRFDMLNSRAAEDSGKILQLASWCKKNGLTFRMREAAKKLIAVDKDHAGAHKLLSQVKFGNKWVARSKAFSKAGRIRHKGSWLSAKDSLRLREAKREKARVKRLQRRMNSYVRRIYSANAKTSEKAYVQLLSFAKKEKVKGLRPLAARFYRDAAAKRQVLASATVTTRYQQASLTRMRERTLGLGNGGGVRIQLPETRRIGIGTTVGVPLR